MRANINFNHFAEAAEDIEAVMAEIERLFLLRIAEQRAYKREPFIRTRWIRKDLTITPVSYDEYWAENWDDKKRFPTPMDADARIQKAITTDGGYGYVHDDSCFGPCLARFEDLASYCASLYRANEFRKKMAREFSEAKQLKASSVSLSDKDLSNADYYRRQVTT